MSDIRGQLYHCVATHLVSSREYRMATYPAISVATLDIDRARPSTKWPDKPANSVAAPYTDQVHPSMTCLEPTCMRDVAGIAGQFSPCALHRLVRLKHDGSRRATTRWTLFWPTRSLYSTSIARHVYCCEHGTTAILGPLCRFGTTTHLELSRTNEISAIFGHSLTMI